MVLFKHANDPQLKAAFPSSPVASLITSPSSGQTEVGISDNYVHTREITVTACWLTCGYSGKPPSIMWHLRSRER